MIDITAAPASSPSFVGSYVVLTSGVAGDTFAFPTGVSSSSGVLTVTGNPAVVYLALFGCDTSATPPQDTVLAIDEFQFVWNPL
jgi:hypothetical protein